MDGDLAYTAAGGSLVSTGFTARVGEDASISIQRTSGHHLWRDDVLVSLEIMASDVNAHEQVVESWMLKSGDLRQGEKAYAYVVLTAGAELQDFLREAVPALVGGDDGPDEIIVVRKIPLNALGGVAEDVLRLLPVVAASDIASFEEALSSESGDEAVVVVRQEKL